MPELTPIKTRKRLAVLEQFGFQKVSQRGSHLKLRKTGSIQRGVIVPMHEEIPVGTLRSVLRQAGIERDEFIKMLDR